MAGQLKHSRSVHEPVSSESLPVPDPSPAVAPDAEPADAGRACLARHLVSQLAIALPAINLFAAVATYVFIDYVVPLPGGAEPAAARSVGLLVAAGMTAIAWLICDIWSRHAFRPIRAWLDRGGAPSAHERERVLRLPLVEAGHVLAIWATVGVAFGLLDVALGGEVVTGVLIGVMVAIGGLVASALCYLATEWLVRPVTGLALAFDPPTRAVTPGIATRLYLAWEFGTAVAIGGATVTAIAYLAGAQMSAQRMAATVIFLGVVALTVGAVTLMAAVRSVVVPVRDMRRAMAAVEAGDTDVSVRVDDGSEVGLLQAGFNRMVHGLRERDRVRDLFGRHVGEPVAQSALRREDALGGELRDAAVLFVDVIGSTSFAAERDPREVVDTLNRFFSIVVEVITMHGGWVNKFEGDAALCAFGAPTEHPDAAGAALAAGRELRRRLDRELDGLDAAIGLSAGRVVAGNIGAAERYEYTVIGDPVNEAARLTEQAKSAPGRLLASEAIVALAGEREANRWRLGESAVLRGRTRTTRAATPV